METSKNKKNNRKEKISPLLFVVLVPHRDCLPDLEAYRRDLFSAGLNGAFSFPAAAPLAFLKRPLDSGELKSLAAELRKLLEEKKIISRIQGECKGWTQTVDLSEEVRFFGSVLELPRLVFPSDAVLQYFEKPILAPAIIPSGGGPDLYTVTAPPFMFRAAALANLAMKPVSDEENTAKNGVTALAFFEKNYSFSWKIGPLFWLPRHIKKSDSSGRFNG